MARKDEGEFELVLGNRQLLSGFFIVVILFGVFFTMGYIVGRHSSPTPVAAPSAGQSAPSTTARPPSEASASLSPGQGEVVSVEPKKPISTQPATEAPSSDPPVSRRASEPAADASPVPPAPGNYLQVSAPRRAAAEAVIDSLKINGIQAVLAPGPDAETVRVLVGPFEDAAASGAMRTKLESAGFKPFSKKY